MSGLRLVTRHHKIYSTSPERASFLRQEAPKSTPLTQDDTNIKRARLSVISEETPGEQTEVGCGSSSAGKSLCRQL